MDGSTTRGSTAGMETTETEALLGLAREIVERQLGALDTEVVLSVFRRLCFEMDTRPDLEPEGTPEGVTVH